jgi:phosphatidylglycerol:prolipoprotein diacylglycerol transferase
MHPVLLRIGPINLYTYGALLAVAFLMGIYLAMRAAEREGIETEFVADLGILVMLSAIVGARLFYVVFYDLQNTLENPGQLFKLQQTGLVFYGGLIFAVGAGIVFSKLKGVSIPVVMDIAAPSIALGQSIGRIGCFMSGCCYGAPTWASWAVKFPHLDQLRHPTQIYESLATFGIFLALMWFRGRRTAPGQVAWLYVVMYATARFAIEFLRGDNPQALLGFTVSQVMSLLALIAVLPLGYFIWFARDGGRSGADAPEESGGRADA